jgi:hypothetical protein
MKDLYKLGATEVVALLRKREVSPLELVESSAERFQLASYLEGLFGVSRLTPIDPR